MFFQPHPSENEHEEEAALTQILEVAYQLKRQNNFIKIAEFQGIISSLNPKKSSGRDLITGGILRDLSTIGIKYLTKAFAAVLLKGYLLAQCEVA
jgi:hypothetical protein